MLYLSFSTSKITVNDKKMKLERTYSLAMVNHVFIELPSGNLAIFIEKQLRYEIQGKFIG